MIKNKKFFLFLIWLFVFINTGRSLAQNLDVNILKSINPRYPTSQYWRGTSNSAYYVAGAASFGTLIYGLASDNATVKHNAVETLISLGANVLVTDLIKISVNRTRPADRYPDLIFVNTPTHNQSFPSGHTSLAFATATTLSMQYKKWYVTVPAYVWASSVAYSRMYLGKHYPTDVLAGAAVGIGTAYAGHWFNQKLFQQRQKSKKFD
ncbi:phosphatase PAP2 family protein [Mucilaginibacter sp. SG564]|uniref:phosphatase PAP2 family protein n=1 Tax=unclassified Mucilaginibacter TaxID=2617802 RepID=UPI0015538AD4|nr:phosphatase PAP2 family protein [Mucilaginibacter sp. SG564]NOW93717.1 membrane-associated phospholipid phosphatase [Mucilaginibacter sp. SG564]